MMMPRVALVGWSASVVELLQASLAGEGYSVDRLALDADTVRTLARTPPGVVVIDRHPYVDVRALLSDIRAHADLAAVPIVLVGPSEPVEVPGIEVVRERGRTLDMGALMDAIGRAVNVYVG